MILDNPPFDGAIAPDEPKRAVVNERSNYRAVCDQERFIVPLLREEIERCLKRYFACGSPGRKALDVGCGKQPFRTQLEQLGFCYFGMDVCEQIGYPLDAEGAIDASIPGEALRAGPFDLIFCTEVMEHVADWHRAFDNFGRLLSPNGRLLITCPQFYQLHEEPYDFWRPTVHAIDYFARRWHLRVVELRAAGDGWDVLGTVLANITNVVPAQWTLWHRAVAKVWRIAVRQTLRLMIGQNSSRQVHFKGPLYMSNVVLLEKIEVPA